MPPILSLPGQKKPKLCIWADLSVHHMDQINAEISTNGKRQLLRSILKIDDSPRSEILLDLFLNTLRFAKLHKFKKDQTSALFSIVKQTHEIATSTPFGNMEECFEYFREMMLLHTVHRPPWSIEVFNAQQLEEITAYVINTYFRHYKLYKYAFTPKVRLDLSIKYKGRASTPEPIELDDDEEDVEMRQESQCQISDPPSPRSAATESPKQDTPKLAEAEEPPSELEIVVRKAVTEQIKQMQLNVERQLEDTDKIINEKIQLLEQGQMPVSPKSKKSPKGSARSRKK